MRVVAARNLQLRRFFDKEIYTNAQNAVTKLGFSARGYDRIRKRIRTTGCA